MQKYIASLVNIRNVKCVMQIDMLLLSVVYSGIKQIDFSINSNKTYKGSQTTKS